MDYQANYCSLLLTTYGVVVTVKSLKTRCLTFRSKAT